MVMKDFDYNPDLYTLEDENGEQLTFELLDTYEENGTLYYAMVPVYENPEDSITGDAELVVLKVEGEGDDEALVSVDDEEEYDRIGGIFLERLEGYYDGDEDEDYDSEDFDGDDYDGEES